MSVLGDGGTSRGLNQGGVRCPLPACYGGSLWSGDSAGTGSGTREPATLAFLATLAARVGRDLGVPRRSEPRLESSLKATSRSHGESLIFVSAAKQVTAANQRTACCRRVRRPGRFDPRQRIAPQGVRVPTRVKRERKGTAGARCCGHGMLRGRAAQQITERTDGGLPSARVGEEIAGGGFEVGVREEPLERLRVRASGGPLRRQPTCCT